MENIIQEVYCVWKRGWAEMVWAHKIGKQNLKVKQPHNIPK